MLLKDLSINEFRLFKNQDIKLGKYITVFAGENTTGKSTLLGMLGNCAELKKSEGATYFSKKFQAVFHELFKGSKQFDKSGSGKYKIAVCDDDGTETDYRDFRVTWQKEKTGTRFRVIPYQNINGKRKDSKFKLPVIFLGLSRLYPVGEVKDEGIIDRKHKFDSDEHREWFVKNYNEILSNPDDIQDVSNLSIKGMEKKSVAVSTEHYDYLCNSAGQDNVGQILLSILSFKKYREDNPESKGGLLLIDELDATLHQSAEEKLLSLIIHECRELKIQVVFTTHSLSLLEDVCRRTKYNKEHENNKVELYYFTKRNYVLQKHRNIPFERIKYYLTNKASLSVPKIKVYSEDEEARWFLNKLIENRGFNLEILDINIGCTDLIALLNADPLYFGNVLIVFDGDVTEGLLNTINEKHYHNYIKLPGDGMCIEKMFHEYLIGIEGTHEFYSSVECENSGFTKDYFTNKSPLVTYQNGSDSDKYKQWFKDHFETLNATCLFEHWKQDNEDIVNNFLDNFTSAYNSIAVRKSLPQIEHSKIADKRLDDTNPPVIQNKKLTAVKSS